MDVVIVSLFHPTPMISQNTAGTWQHCCNLSHVIVAAVVDVIYDAVDVMLLIMLLMILLLMILLLVLFMMLLLM